MNEMQANSALRGLVFAVQKARSNLKESLGDIGEELLEDLHPWLFGPKSVLKPLLEWQQRCNQTGTIAGIDLFNFTKLIEMKDPMILAMLPLYGYPDLEPDIAWVGQSWRYLTDGF